MKTISAEEANKISCSNNAEVIERNKKIQEAIENCMSKIESSAIAGNFRARCYCRVKHLDDVCATLKSLSYHVALPVSYESEVWRTYLSTSEIEFEVSWDCLDQ